MSRQVSGRPLFIKNTSPHCLALQQARGKKFAGVHAGRRRLLATLSINPTFAI